jgi:ferric-dicitrate binding protein FerR (iron transport regulator)
MDKKNEYIRKLIERYLAGRASSSETLLIRLWMGSDEDIDRWMREQIEASSPMLSSDVKTRIYDSVVNDRSLKRIAGSAQGQKHRLLERIAAVAAVLLVGVLLGVAVTSRSGEPYTLTVRAGMGEQPTLLLPDGTDVRLNAMSELTYTFDRNAHTRFVTLSGEAYFKVAHDERNPFKVSADSMTVECLGTAFDVRAYPDDNAASVLLTEGKVRVCTRGFEEVLSPNTLLCVDRLSNSVSRRAVCSDNYINWNSGFVTFDNAPLSDIANAVHRATGVELRFDDPSLADTRFVGTLCIRDFASVVNVLSHVADVEVSLEGDSLALISRP